MKLHDYWRSSASYRVRIALGLAGETWTAQSVNLVEGAQTSESHLKANPQGLVPVLEIDGVAHTQSLAIIEYIDETRNTGLLPQDPHGRARVRALAYAIAMEVHPICNLRVATWAVAKAQQPFSMQDWMTPFIRDGLAAYERMVEGEVYSYGNSVTLADVCLMPQLYNAERWGVSLEDLPRISRIANHLATIPAFQAAHPDLWH